MHVQAYDDGNYEPGPPLNVTLRHTLRPAAAAAARQITPPQIALFTPCDHSRRGFATYFCCETS